MAAHTVVTSQLAWHVAILVLLVSVTQADTDVCSVSGSDRVNCGYPGITEDACVTGKACCYDETIPNVPHCYHDNECSVSHDDRRDCGYPGVTRATCVKGGRCCYDDTTPDTIHCHFDGTVPADITGPAGCSSSISDTLPCAADQDPNIPEQKCYVLGCCYNPTDKHCYTPTSTTTVGTSPTHTTITQPYYTIVSPQNTTSYTYSWVVADHPSTTFRLKTCRQGLLLLTEVPWVTTRNALEISMAKDFIVLRDKVTQTVLKNVVTPNDWLNCDLAREVWVSWEGSVLSLGEGHLVGAATLLTYKLTDGGYMFLLSGYSFSSSPASPQGATWEIDRKEVQSMFAETSRANDDRQLQVVTNDHVVFGVRSDYDVKLSLAKRGGSKSEIININLSPSGMSSINHGDNMLANAETRGLLNRFKTTFFWIKWSNDYVEVGRGMQTGEEIFMRTLGRFNIDLTVMLITSRTSPASWVMHGFEVNSFKLVAYNNLPDDQAYRINIQNKNTFLFRVKACENAILELKSNPNTDGVRPDYIRMVIGDETNQLTNIMYLDSTGGTKDIEGVTTADILSCYAMKYMWISWKDASFKLGTGSKVFENQLFDKPDKVGPRTFQWLHLASQDEVDVTTWQFDEYQGNRVLLPTAFPELGDVSKVSYSLEGRHSLVFKVRGDHDATLTLGHYLAFSVGNQYKVDIGTLKDDDNMYCSISRTDGNKTETRTPKIISTDVTKYFWVSWFGGYIELGRGSVVGEAAILAMKHKEMYEINAVHLTGGTHVEWTLNGIEVDRYSIHTSTAASDNSYENNWLATHLRIFPFMVRSPNPVSVVLTKTPFEHNNLEITFGILDNTHTSVRFIGDNSSYKQAPSDDLLSDFEMVPLWFTYYDTTLQVGSGDIRYENIIMIYDTKQEFEWSGVILNNDSPAPVEWSILPETVNQVKKKTPATYGHRFLWRSLGLVSSLVFKVKAGADAHILLSPAIEETTNDVIELTLGYNKNQTIIRNGTKGNSGAILESVQSPNVLSDQEYRTFWVSWNGGEIRLGTGDHVGVDPIIDWTLADPLPFHAISMCTSSTKGTWIILEVTRDLYHISTPPKGDYTKFGYFQVYSSTPFLQFGVVTCTSARLLLIHSGTVTQDHHFEVVIGENMTDTAKLYELKHLVQKEELTTSTMPGVVSCGFEEIFWLSWDKKMIRLGKGNYPSKILFEYEHTEVVALQSMALGSGDDGKFNVPTLWQIRPNTIEHLAYHTLAPKNYNQFWGSASSNKYLRFEVFATGNISIVITNIPQVVSSGDYEFTLHQKGANDDLTISKSGVQKSTKSVKSLGLYKTSRYMWVSWEGSQISLGVGLAVGSGALITYTDEQPLDINFFSIASIDGQADWYLNNAQGNVYEAYTPDTVDTPANYHRVQFAPVNFLTYFQFTVRGCQNARMALISDPLDFSLETYEVIIDTIDQPTGSKYSAIRSSINGTNMGIKKDDNYLISCNEVTDLWVEWDKGIRVGEGQWPGAEVMHYTPLIWTFKPNLIAMSSGPGSDGNWMFPFDQAEAVFVNISLNSRNTRAKIYDYFWMGVRDRTSVVFSVKLAKHALVQLSQVAFQGGAAAYELEMDRLDGFTAIRGPDGIELVKKSLPRLLSADMYKAFWLSWDNAMLSFGAGGTPYVNKLLSTPTGPATDFFTLGVASGTAMGGGEWSFLRSRGRVYRLTTPAKDGDTAMFLMVQRDVVTFQVRACSEAMLLLVGTRKTIFEDTLQISIGTYGNTKVEIRHVSRDDPVASGTFPNLLDCNQLRPFWVSWTDGIIRVGSGTDLSRDLLSWVFRDLFGDDIRPFEIGSVAPVTRGDGEWEFDFHQSACETQYTKVYPAAAGRRSRCPSSTSLTTTHLQDCIHRACQAGTEVFQYRKGRCELLQCERGPAWNQLVQEEEGTEGYDIYVTDTNKTDETYIAYTGKTYHYEQHWVSMTGEMNTTFMVQACSDAHLALVAIPANQKTLAYEIVIGGNKNRESWIRPKVGALVTPVVKENTPYILNCHSPRPFWVSWYDNEISAGIGAVVGLEPFIRWVPDEPIHVVNSVGLSTGSGNKGTWVFGNLDIELPPEEKVDKYIIGTGADNKYLTTFIPANNFLTFGVQACSDAFVRLNAVPGHPEVEAFFVGIGTNNNQEVSISVSEDSASQPPVVQPVKDVLNCNYSRTFWVKWGVDVISLGKFSKTNPVGEKPLIQFHQQEMPELHSVSIATGTAGTWQVNRSLAFYTETITQPAAQPTFSEFWVTMETTSELVFSVKACVGVHLKVGHDKDEPKNYYLVDIGTDSNVKSMIRDGSNGAILAETITTNILDCNALRWFWVYWHQGLEVGTGRTPGARSILRTGLTYPVRALGFSTENNQKGQFRFADIEDDSFYVLTPGDSTFQHAWVLSQNNFLNFKVRACTGAMIRLTNNFLDADPNKPSYEVVIDNGASQIRRLPGYTQLTNATTVKLVQCDLFVQLQVTWAGSEIALRQDGRDIMRATDPNPISVSALSFAAIDTGNQDVAWKFPSHSGKETVLITPQSSQGFNKWVTTADSFIFFKLQADSDAIISACEFVGVMGYGCYDIGLQLISPATPNTCSSYIKSYAGATKTEATYDSCGIFSAKRSVQMWLSWQKDVVEVGLGSTVGYETLMSWDASSHDMRHPVNAISVMTYKDKGYWEFSEVEDKVFEVKTLAYDPAKTPRYTTWLRMDESHLNFKLKACGRAVIVLSETPDNLSGQRYEIEMSKVMTQVYKIPENGVKAILATVNTTGFVDCDNFKEYKLSWTAPWLDFQSLILEEVLGDIKIEVDDEFTTYKVHAVALIAREQYLFNWSFKDDAAAAVSFETGGVKDSEQVVYKLSHTKHFVFKVKGKGPAHVILQEHYHTDTLYEFFIGIEGNTKTAIKAESNTGTTYDAIASTPGILSEGQFRQLWVSWAGHGVDIGYGTIPGVAQILYLPTSNKPINAKYVAITTSAGNSGTWEVSQYPADLVMIGMGEASMANPLVSYQMVDGQTGALFEVKTCEGFSVSLHPVNTDSASYKIEAKLNVLSIYRHSAKVHTATLSRNVEVCYEWRRFYVGWTDGIVHLSGDEAGGWRYIEWEDENPLDVHVVKIPEDGQVARFLLPRYLGGAVEVRQAKPTGLHFPFQNMWYTLSGRSALMFGVKGDTGGAVLFTRTPGIFTHDGYELRISNGNSTLHDKLTGEVVSWKKTPVIINSFDFTYFWAQWDGGALRIGYFGGAGQLFHHNMTAGYDVIAAAFDHNDDVTWSFDQDSGNEFIIATSEDTMFDHAWFALKENIFRFSVMSNQKAVLRLNVQPEYKAPHYTELIFGALDNTAFIMRENGYDTTDVIVENHGTLDRDAYRPFWVLMDFNTIQVGSGHSLEGKFYEKTYLHRISTVSLGDDSVSAALWKIPQDQEVMARFRTPATERFDTHWVTLVGYTSVVMRIQGCDSAHIILVAVLKNLAQPSTLLVIDKAGTSYIIDVAGKNHSVSTPNLLSCDEPRAVWLQWDATGVSFGSGATVGSNTLLVAAESMHLVVAMGLASGISGDKTTSATWDIFRLKGNVFYENVEPDNPQKGVLVAHTDGQAFNVSGQVRTCGGATVSLLPIASEEDTALNIVYGSEGNTQSEIIRGERSVAKASTPYYMNSMIDQLFWVTFKESTVNTGLGLTTQNMPLLTYKDPDTSNFPLMAFTAGQDNTCPAKWMVEIKPDDKLVLQTEKTFSTDTTVISVMDASVILLNIKAKHSAHIALHVIPGNLRFLTWEIVVQEYVSGKTCIREGVGGPLDDCIKRPGLLDGEHFKQFWVYWAGMTLSFGTGWVPSDATRLVFLTSNLRPPFAMVSFATYSNGNVAWEVFSSNITYDSSTSTSVKPTTTPQSTPTTTQATGSHTPSTAIPGHSSTTTISAQTTTTSGGEGGNETTGGLSAGALVGIIFGSILGVGILVFVGLLIVGRFRPNALPFKPPGQLFGNSAYSDIDGNHDDIALKNTALEHAAVEYKDNAEEDAYDTIVSA